MEKARAWNMFLWIAGFVITLGLGIYGLRRTLQMGMSPEILYSALRLFGMDTDVTGGIRLHWTLEVARWLAVFLTSALFYKVFIGFQMFVRGIFLFFRLHLDQDIVVIHGTQEKTKTICKAIGQKACENTLPVCFGARRHVIAFEDDAEGLQYICSHRDELLTRHKQIVFCCSSFESSDYQMSEIAVSNMAVNCARLYWEKNWISEEDVSNIAIIGFGRYGRAVLEQAFLVNVMDRKKPFRYYIYGGEKDAYLKNHPQLKEVLSFEEGDDTKDSVCFCGNVWQLDMDRLKGMDRIILCCDEEVENLRLLNSMLVMGVTARFDIRFGEDMIEQFIMIPERLKNEKQLPRVKVFGRDEELYAQDVLFENSLLDRAKQIHEKYVENMDSSVIRKRYPSCASCRRSGPCADCPGKSATWEDLTPFEKKSNIASADHIPVKKQMLELQKIRKEEDASEEQRLALEKVEHIRWERLYYLYGWQYSPQRDDSRRLHDCLRPFDELTEEQKRRDWSGYQYLLEFDK